VICRTREIGIRLAVGAGRQDVMWMVLRTALVLATAGLALALPLVWYAKRYIEGQLFGLEGADPMSLATAAVVLLTSALASGAWPAWRAARLDPMISLRQE
jgi:ABC-type antimicrobial peptide transport system permease subunit